MEKNHFLTTYNKDYKPKKVEKRKTYGTEQEYDDPINEGFRSYLKIKSNKHPLKRKEEFADTYLEKFKEIYPKLGRAYFEAPLNESVIERDFLMGGQTVYQVDYCDFEKDKVFTEESKEKDKVNLPDDWIIPQTTAAMDYRDPRVMEPDALHVVQPIRPPKGTWGTSSDVADILQLITGKSEYQGVIGALGDIVMKDQIHGKIVHPKCTCAMHNLQEGSE